MATKATKMSEIRERADDELKSSLGRARDELFRLRLNRFTNQLTDVTQIRKKRREVARVITAIGERKRGTGKAVEATPAEAKE